MLCYGEHYVLRVLVYKLLVHVLYTEYVPVH